MNTITRPTSYDAAVGNPSVEGGHLKRGSWLTWLTCLTGVKVFVYLSLMLMAMAGQNWATQTKVDFISGIVILGFAAMIAATLVIFRWSYAWPRLAVFAAVIAAVFILVSTGVLH